MKARSSVKMILLGALMMPGLTACSLFGGGDEAPAEEVAANGEENAAAEPEGEGEANAEANTEATAEGNAADANLPTNEAGLANDVPVDSNNLGTDNATIPSDLLGNNANGLGAADAPPGGEAAPLAADPALADPAAAPAAPTMMPSGSVRVYFVNVPSAPLRDKPDGQTVGELKMGDPVLVSVEGTWANIVNRGYIELASLSMNPVARPKEPTSWN